LQCERDLACTTTAAMPVPTAKRRSSPQSRAGIRGDRDRRPRTRFGTGALRDKGWHLWIASKLRLGRLVRIVESIAKRAEEQGVAEAFFDKITTAAWHRTLHDGGPNYRSMPRGATTLRRGRCFRARDPIGAAQPHIGTGIAWLLCGCEGAFATGIRSFVGSTKFRTGDHPDECRLRGEYNLLQWRFRKRD
jgi:hypothetical protein